MTTANQVSSGRRRVVVSAAIGQFVEWYDFVIYAYTASVVATLFFPSDDRTASLLATFGVYAVGFVMRPSVAWSSATSVTCSDAAACSPSSSC